MFCSQCGAQLPDGSTFCSTCGAKVATDPFPPPPPPPPPVPVPVTTDSASADSGTPVAPVTPTPPPAESPSPVGSYQKAPVGVRFVAFLADGIIASALLPIGIILIVAASSQGKFSIAGAILAVLGSLWEITYLLGRDAFKGAGWGKRLMGLVVVSPETGTIASAGKTIVRQVVLYALEIIPLVGGLIEPVMVLVDKKGERLGDKAAKTQVVRNSEASTRGLPVSAGKGAAAGALIGALLLGIIGSAIGGLVFARALSDTSNTVVSTLDAPEVEIPAQEQAAEAPAEAEAPVEQPAEAEPANPVTAASALNAESSVNAVGNLLNYLKENDVDAARGYATKGFQKDKDWFFSPAGGALASFEVTDAYQDQAIWVVEVSEDWNSGPEKSRYFVVEEDGAVLVDDMEFLDQ